MCSSWCLCQGGQLVGRNPQSDIWTKLLICFSDTQYPAAQHTESTSASSLPFSIDGHHVLTLISSGHGKGLGRGNTQQQGFPSAPILSVPAWLSSRIALKSLTFLWLAVAITVVFLPSMRVEEGQGSSRMIRPAFFQHM